MWGEEKKESRAKAGVFWLQAGSEGARRRGEPALSLVHWQCHCHSAAAQIIPCRFSPNQLHLGANARRSYPGILQCPESQTHRLFPILGAVWGKLESLGSARCGGNSVQFGSRDKGLREALRDRFGREVVASIFWRCGASRGCCLSRR